MVGNSTLFGRKTQPVHPEYFHPEKPAQKPRKKRSDAKRDIKFKLEPEDKKSLKLGAFDHNLSLTAFASHIVKKSLLKTSEFQQFDYADSGQFVHVVLEDDFFEMVKSLSLDWDVPFRHVVYRIVMDFIYREYSKVEIITYK